MNRELIGAAVPGTALMAGFLAAGLWQSPLVPVDRACAERVVGRLQASGLEVRGVYRWSHLPFRNAPCATTVATSAGNVQGIVFDDAHSLQSFRVSETRPSAGTYRYVVNGGPDAPNPSTWESRYPWFWTIEKNWLLVTHDAALKASIER